MNETLLDVKGLTKYFPVTRGLILAKVEGWVKAVDGVDFTINKGETYGLVGESGCGKTTTAKLILLLEKVTAGSIYYGGKDILTLKGKDLLGYRRAVQAVFQDPMSSLNPRMKVRDIISEPILSTNSLPIGKVADRIAECLEQVRLKPGDGALYPHEFSGGQRQRIAVASALAPSPELIVLDEPVSALDVSIRAQAMNLLKELQEETGISYLMIAHDLAAVKYMSNRIGVMYLGKLVERAESEELYANPLHPYTKALFSATLPSHPDVRRERIILQGEVPSPLNPPTGCRFHPRCSQSIDVCSKDEPLLEDVGSNHQIACHNY